MTLPTWYDAGTVSVAGSSTTVTGINTLWGGDAIMTGDLFCDPAQPLVPPQRIKQVVSDTEIELWAPWPGSAMTEASYEIRYVGIIERSTAQSRRVLEDFQAINANRQGLFFRFDDATADSDPGVGRLRLNNADPAQVTAIYIDDLDASGASVAGEIDSWGATVAPVRGRIWLRSISNPSSFHSYSVIAAVVDGTGYRILTVVHVGGAGGFASDDGLMVAFVPNGSQGAGYSYSAEVLNMDGLEIYEEEPAGFRVWVFDLGGINANRSGVVELNDEGGWDIAAIFTGPQGEQGMQGFRGWSPVLAVVSDMERRVVRLVDYTGGAGTKPAAGIGMYVGPDGMVSDPGNATNVRGATGDIEGLTSFWVGRVTVDATAAAARTGLGIVLASQGEAEAGTDNTRYMTPLRTAQAIQVLVPPSKDYDLEISQIALKLAMMEGEAWAYGGGPNGNGYADDLTSLDQIDVAGATNLDTSEAGVLKPTGVVSSMYEQVGGNSALSSARTFRFVFDASRIPASGLKVRVRLTGSTLGAQASFSGVFIGEAAASGDPYDFAATPAQLTFSGENNITLAASESVWSDWLDLAIDDNKSYVISFNRTAGTVNGSINPSAISGIAGYSTTTASDGATVNASGYSSFAGTVNLFFLDTIEVFSGISDLSVASESFAADAPPTEMRLLAMVEEVDAAVIGDDYVFEVSRDGTDWTIITMEQVALDIPDRKMFSGVADVSGLDPGTSLKWRLSTTAVMVKLHDYVIHWRG